MSFTEATKQTNNQAEIDQKLNHPASKKSHIIFSLLLLQYSENVGKGRKFQIGDCKKLAITAAYFYRETSETHSWTEPQAFVLLEYFSLETAFWHKSSSLSIHFSRSAISFPQPFRQRKHIVMALFSKYFKGELVTRTKIAGNI